MKKPLVWLGLVLAMVGPLTAQSPRRAMVLKVDGPVLAGPQKVLTGQFLDLGSSLQLAAGSSLTLLMLNKGQRLEIKGQGSLQLNASGLELKGCSSRVLDSNQQKLSLTGENHRAIGGAVLRGPVPMTLTTTPFDKIEVLDGAKPAMLVSRPAGEGSPPSLRFGYTSPYTRPSLSNDGTATVGRPNSVEIEAASVPGEVAAGRWQWRIPWPASDQKSLSLTLKSLDKDESLLYTFVYLTSPQEEKELHGMARAAQQWSVREPKNIQPFVLYASLLAERGRLEEARQQLDKALAIANKEAGLLQMKSNVLTELGRYSQAGALLKSTR